MKKTIWLILLLAVLTASLVTAVTPACSDGIDNDGDGFMDTNDPGCYDTGAYDADDDDETDTLPVCSNYFDDDGDGKVDTADPGCYDSGSYDADDDSEADTLPVCSNYFDDDGDGAVDEDDWGCYTEQGIYDSSDNNEANPACSDGSDNDGDGVVDSHDYGCYTEQGVYKPYDNDEANPQCSDEIDNDKDCVADFPYDPGCQSVYDNSESPNPPGRIVICTEDFGPRIWLCDDRVLIDDEIQTGRVQGSPVESKKDWLLKGYELIERHNNYAFEGEKIEWLVLVMDKNKIEEIQEVVVTIGSVQGPGNDIEVECVDLGDLNMGIIMPSCEAWIDEEKLEKDDFDHQIMSYYECTLTVETPYSMYGEYFVTIEALDTTGLSGTIDENEYWFFNPELALSVEGELNFGIIRPGTLAYSETLLVGNDADPGSGVMLDMFISGTDFYDLDNSGARCVLTNRLKLGDNVVAAGDSSASNVCAIGFTDTDDHLCYYATSGAYSTQNDARRDAEGYAPIVYGDSFTRDFYNDAEIIQDGAMGAYWQGNMLSPESEMAVTFKLGLPVPCVGTFDSGQIYFWGEAI